MSDRSDKSRKSWNTDDEIKFIDRLPTKRVSIAEYVIVLSKRRDWTGIDRKKVFKHIRELL